MSSNIRLFSFLSVYVEHSIFDLYQFTRQADYSMDDTMIKPACLENYYVSSLRISKPVSRFAHDDELTIVEARFHAEAMDLEIMHHRANSYEE